MRVRDTEGTGARSVVVQSEFAPRNGARRTWTRVIGGKFYDFAEVIWANERTVYSVHRHETACKILTGCDAWTLVKVIDITPDHTRHLLSQCDWCGTLAVSRRSRGVVESMYRKNDIGQALYAAYNHVWLAHQHLGGWRPTDPTDPHVIRLVSLIKQHMEERARTAR